MEERQLERAVAKAAFMHMVRAMPTEEEVAVLVRMCREAKEGVFEVCEEGVDLWKGVMSFVPRGKMPGNGVARTGFGPDETIGRVARGIRQLIGMGVREDGKREAGNGGEKRALVALMVCFYLRHSRARPAGAGAAECWERGDGLVPRICRETGLYYFE